MDDSDRLANVGYISIAQTTQRRIGDFTLDPDILLPIEIPPGAASIAAGELRWEAIVAGTLKVLAGDPANEHADYYRRFVLAVKPNIKDEFTNVGILKARNGNAEVSIEIFRALGGLFPDDAVTCMNLALAYEERARQLEKLGRDEQVEELQNLAFESYKAALAADPTEPTIHYNLAYFYLHQRSFEKAREHLAVFAQSGTDEKRVREARRIIREIDEQGLMDGLFQKAFDCIRMGKEEEGIVHAKEFLSSRPGVPNAWFLLGWANRRLGRYGEGRDAFLKALSLGSPHADLLNELAICLMELGEISESRKRLTEALALEPENTKVISNLGILALKTGGKEEAIGFFRTVLEIEPEDPIASRYLQDLT
ncbi:MAG: tetratricopeptide repeat protein [Spirochaetia bacterium]|jgi:Flp pilus assembly protein TadD